MLAAVLLTTAQVGFGAAALGRGIAALFDPHPRHSPRVRRPDVRRTPPWIAAGSPRRGWGLERINSRMWLLWGVAVLAVILLRNRCRSR